MLRTEVARGGGGRVMLVDSITQITPEDAGAIVVCGSHGGTSSAAFALEVPLAAVFFNDAGVGKEDAGIAALRILQAKNVAAAVIAHTSARIGDARDTWEHGVISRVNAAAQAQGFAPGMRLCVAVNERVLR